MVVSRAPPGPSSGTPHCTPHTHSGPTPPHGTRTTHTDTDTVTVTEPHTLTHVTRHTSRHVTHLTRHTSTHATHHTHTHTHTHSHTHSHTHTTHTHTQTHHTDRQSHDRHPTTEPNVRGSLDCSPGSLPLPRPGDVMCSHWICSLRCNKLCETSGVHTVHAKLISSLYSIALLLRTHRSRATENLLWPPGQACKFNIDATICTTNAGPRSGSTQAADSDPD